MTSLWPRLINLVRAGYAWLVVIGGVPLIRDVWKPRQEVVRKVGSTRTDEFVVDPDEPDQCAYRGSFCDACPFKSDCNDPALPNYQRFTEVESAISGGAFYDREPDEVYLLNGDPYNQLD